MIITKKYAQKLIREGKAVVITSITENNRRYIAIDRHDKNRVDHYEDNKDLLVEWKA